MTTPRKVALVTGSATGIAAVAIRFATKAAVAVNYSRSKKERWRRPPRCKSSACLHSLQSERRGRSSR